MAVKTKKAAFTVTDKRSFGQTAKIEVPACPKVKAAPLGSKVILWRIPVAEGLVVDPNADKPLECEVVAVSTSGLSEFDVQALSQLKIGDKVLIRKNSGTEVKVEGHEVTILHVMDILCRL